MEVDSSQDSLKKKNYYNFNIKDVNSKTLKKIILFKHKCQF